MMWQSPLGNIEDKRTSQINIDRKRTSPAKWRGEVLLVNIEEDFTNQVLVLNIDEKRTSPAKWRSPLGKY